MAYSTLSDLEKNPGREKLVQLTDLDRTGEIDDARVTEAIAKADALIDAYCTVPSPTPELIRTISATLAEFYLHDMRGVAGEAEWKKYDRQVSMLKDISKGVITLGGTVAAHGTNTIASSTSESDREFTKETMADF